MIFPTELLDRYDAFCVTLLGGVYLRNNCEIKFKDFCCNRKAKI